MLRQGPPGVNPGRDRSPNRSVASRLQDLGDSMGFDEQRIRRRIKPWHHKSRAIAVFSKPWTQVRCPRPRIYATLRSPARNLPTGLISITVHSGPPLPFDRWNFPSPVRGVPSSAGPTRRCRGARRCRRGTRGRSLRPSVVRALQKSWEVVEASPYDPAYRRGKAAGTARTARTRSVRCGDRRPFADRAVTSQLYQLLGAVELDRGDQRLVSVRDDDPVGCVVLALLFGVDGERVSCRASNPQRPIALIEQALGT
jgi:hypothetical protein